MKKLFLSILLIGLTTFGGFVLASNSFTLTQHFSGSIITSADTVYRWGSANTFDIVVEVDMKNNSDTSITYKWTKLKSDMVSLSWEVAICDKNNCYVPSINTQQFTLSPSESGIMNAHFYPDGIVGEGTLITEVKNLSDSTDADTIIYKAKAYPTGIGDSKLLTYELNVYPNPANKFVNISLPSNKTQEVEIYNILGSKLAVFKLTNPIIYNISDLPDGLYFVKIKDEKGVVRTKSFIRN